MKRYPLCIVLLDLHLESNVILSVLDLVLIRGLTSNPESNVNTSIALLASCDRYKVADTFLSHVLVVDLHRQFFWKSGFFILMHFSEKRAAL